MIHFLTKSHSSIRHRYSIWHIMWWLTVFYTCYIFPISVTSLSSCRLLRLVTLSYMRIPPVLNLSNVKRYYTLLQAANQHARGFSHFFNSIHKCNTQTERVSSPHLFDTQRSVRPLSMTRQSRNKHEHEWVKTRCAQQLLSDGIGLQDIPCMLSILMPWLTPCSIFQWVPVLLTRCLKILFVRGRASLIHQCKSELHRHNKHQKR